MKSFLEITISKNMIMFFIFIISINLITSSKTRLLTKNSDSIIPMMSSIDSCSCALSFPQCCTPEFEIYNCSCAPRPVCGICPGNESLVNIHDNMMKLAMKDAFNQEDLARKAKLQVDLFQKAQEYAREVGIQEMKAKQYANLLNESTKRAQYSRTMMFNAANQVRYFADQTLRAIQPIKCIGVKCANSQLIVENLSNPMYMTGGGINSFMFKEKENETLENYNSNKYNNLRGFQ